MIERHAYAEVRALIVSMAKFMRCTAVILLIRTELLLELLLPKKMSTPGFAVVGGSI